MMSTWWALLTLVVGAVIASILQKYDLYALFKKDEAADRKPAYVLAVGILSARDHFEARSAIRDTWLKELNTNNRGRGWFVVGDVGCDIHPDQREDPYSCRPWDISLPVKNQDIQVITTEKMTTGPQHFRRKAVLVLHFKVMHSVVVSRIGLLEAVAVNTSAVQVSLYDRTTEEILTTATFSGTDPGISKGQFMFQPVDAVKLPKGFEGYISVDMEGSQIADINDKLPSLPYTTTISNVSGVLKIQDMTSDSVELIKGDNRDHVHLMTFVLGIQELNKLSEHVMVRQRMNRSWKKKQTAIDLQLRKEAEKYRDIVFVNVTDVYRNLATKLLLYHQWLYDHINASYVLKTDDDCFVNIASVISTLDKMDRMEETFWWGNFRDQWMVEQFGKWAELAYTTDVYPKFACGVGSVVSKGIHYWLSQNGDDLKVYQGEDVSMGIWMAARQVTYVKDDRWKCTKDCSPDSIAIPELSPQEVRTAWDNREMCGNPCECVAG